MNPTITAPAGWDRFGGDYDEMDRCGVCLRLALAVKRTPLGEVWRCLVCGADYLDNLVHEYQRIADGG